ncbi:DUF305 domain-containing protein [Streptomyces sp. NPDC088387]|uniref:DUF305 domain-containing protein n=1 Tax=Streptomyces sp. NPDC088387 TaxID=3365859 RepID=UPI0038237691
MAGPAAGAGRAGGPRLVVALLCVLLTVSGCAGSPSRAGTPPRTAGTTGSPADTSSPAATATGTFSTTDIAWLQLLIAMDDQNGLVLGLVPRRGGDPALKTWAAGVARDNRAQLSTLRELLAQAGVPDSNPHEGHDMPGMVTGDELRALEDASGAPFDRLLRAALRDHLGHAEHLSRAERANGSDTRVTGFAATVRDAAVEHRDRMPG